jgi:sugar-specific transcriptional regulator TrmB
MDANKQVEAKAAVLAEAANVPLGSLHSILQFLEKKGLIKNTRAGSVRAPAAYQVLQQTARPIDEAEQAA